MEAVRRRVPIRWQSPIRIDPPSTFTAGYHSSSIQWGGELQDLFLFPDGFTGAIVHLTARDSSFAVVSRALAKIQSFRRPHGWTFLWLSSFGNDFIYDFPLTLDEAEGSVEYNYESTATLLQAGKIRAANH